jgi:Uma2 family endonuclease
VRFEYLDGNVYAMSGGSALHSRLCATVANLLESQLRSGPCRPCTSDLRIRVESTDLTTYPDVTVICGAPKEDPPGKQCYTNPLLIVEVLSPSTQEYDRDEKFEHYKRIDTFREYVLVWQDDPRIEVRTLQPAGWSFRTYHHGEAAVLHAVNARLDVRELYALAAIPS